MITVRDIEVQDLERIMLWRMSDSVNRFMNTSPNLTMEKQLEWFRRIQTDKKNKYWLVEQEDSPVGIIDLLDIDFEKKCTSWGYYVGEVEARSLKLAVSLEMSLYDYCFDELGMEVVRSDVFEENVGVWKLHIACGCHMDRIVPNEVTKDGKCFNVVHLSMTKFDWCNLRTQKSYEKIKFSDRDQ